MNENEAQPPKPMGLSKSSATGKVHSSKRLPQKTREKSNTPKAGRKGRNEEPQGQLKERNNKNQSRNK